MFKHEVEHLRPLEKQVTDEYGLEVDGQALLEYSELLIAHYPDHEVGIIRAIGIFFKNGAKETDIPGALCVFHSIEDGTRNPILQNNEII